MRFHVQENQIPYKKNTCEQRASNNYVFDSRIYICASFAMQAAACEVYKMYHKLSALLSPHIKQMPVAINRRKRYCLRAFATHKPMRRKDADTLEGSPIITTRIFSKVKQREVRELYTRASIFPGYVSVTDARRATIARSVSSLSCRDTVFTCANPYHRYLSPTVLLSCTGA